MLLGWFDAREAAGIGVALADQFATHKEPRTSPAGRRNLRALGAGEALNRLLRDAERRLATARLNFYKKAKLANTFKWRLIENGVDRDTADDVTQTLITHLSLSGAHAAGGKARPATHTAAAVSTLPRKPAQLLALADRHVADGAFTQACECYRNLLQQRPRHAAAANNLGAALCKLGRYREAEPYFRRAIQIKAAYAEAHSNLGGVLRQRGETAAAENAFRRALGLRPDFKDARVGLGMTLLLRGDPGGAQAQFDKALRTAPADVEALVGMGHVAATEGRFDAAEASFRRALEANPKSPAAWAALAGLRRMTAADDAWLQQAQRLLADGLAPIDEATLRFAMGKYCDDVADYGAAFDHYSRANRVLKEVADPYDGAAYSNRVDALIKTYSRDILVQPGSGARDSQAPVLVVGMMRSGTSLVEQILASHPQVKAAGELEFWNAAVQHHGAALTERPPDAAAKQALSAAYLQALARAAGEAPRLVDKAPVNSDYLGVIHSVLPQTRIIYVQRHPIDTCLSCYFQQFPLSINFKFELSDLAHYYRQHQRLKAHWQTVLPPQVLLEVPYAGLVNEPERWIRRMLDFLGLEWNPRCLEFHDTKRTVATASAWQVRQKLYTRSVERWRHYAKFIGPLRELRDSNG